VLRPEIARALPSLACALGAALVLLWNLDVRYLWQDEAATAVLGERFVRFGKPLAWDGRNLVTMDYVGPRDAETLETRTRDAESAVRYYAERGDFKTDGTWIGQPWGQFALAGLSLRLLGHGTFQARLPFALAGVLTVVLLFQLARRRFGDPLVAALAAGLLLGNVFWVLHARQCRLYPASSLLLLATLAAYLRWSDGRRWGLPLFVAASWTFFQFDYGLYFPVLGVLGLDALLVRRRSFAETLLAFGVALAAVAPWTFYYELWGRLKTGASPARLRVLGTLFNVNQFVLPFLAVPALALLAWRAPREERRLVSLGLGLFAVLLVWVPLVAPHPYHRYLVAASPVAALLLAFGVAKGAALVTPRPVARAVLAVALAVFLAASPIVSNAVTMWIDPTLRTLHEPGRWLRAEIPAAWLELSGRAPDPNRAVIELLRPRLEPGDEVLVTYEDAPFMFYTDARVRGGIPAFRVEDRSRPPPRFAVVRRSALFLPWNVYRRELDRWRWIELPSGVPDVPFGNSPDPNHRFYPLGARHPEVQVLERVSGEGLGARGPQRNASEVGARTRALR
jgi:hypothetical protein